MKRQKPNFTFIPRGNPMLLGQKSQNLSLGQYFLAAHFFSLLIFYWNCNNRRWYAFTSLVAIL